jgi:hypothetical protein
MTSEAAALWVQAVSTALLFFAAVAAGVVTMRIYDIEHAMSTVRINAEPARQRRFQRGLRGESQQQIEALGRRVDAACCTTVHRRRSTTLFWATQCGTGPENTRLIWGFTGKTSYCLRSSTFDACRAPSPSVGVR